MAAKKREPVPFDEKRVATMAAVAAEKLFGMGPDAIEAFGACLGDCLEQLARENLPDNGDDK